MTANARGFAAIGANPAGLAMPGSGFSLALVPIQLRSGLDPVTLGDLKNFEDTLIPPSTKEEWLARVGGSDGESGTAGADVTALALTLGNFGFQLSTLVSGSLNLAPDVVEAVLFGNAGRTGTPTDLSFGGSSARGFAVTTGGGSFAISLPAVDAEMAIGATVKYSVGHFVVAAEDRGGLVQSDPVRVEVDFPVLHTDDARLDDGEVNNGSGIGLDLGVQWKRDRLALGGAVINVFNSFGWDMDALVYRPGTALLDQGTSETDFDPQPGSGAPAGVRSIIADMKFKPTVAVGAAYDLSGQLTVTADLKNRFGDGLDTGPKFHAGVGAEYRGLRVLHLRGGAAVVTGGIQFGGGVSLVLGPVNFTLAGALRRGSLEDTTIAQAGLSFWGR